MRFDRFTLKSQELIQNANTLASTHGNQQIEPEHSVGGDASGSPIPTPKKNTRPSKNSAGI
jgi:hypothetical protein